MKIIFLNSNLSKGGKERRMIELIKGLLKVPDIEIDLVLFKNRVEYPEIYDMRINLHIIARKPKYNPLTFLKLYRICKQVQPDIIHSWSSMSSIFAFPTIKLLNIKLLNGCIANAPHNLNYLKMEFILAKLTFPYSNIVAGNSKAGLNAFQAPKSKSTCIYNGFDHLRVRKLENPKDIRSKFNLGDNFVIGKVAAFAQRKDYETFISAAQEILEVRDDIRFLAIGNGPNFEKIKNSVPQKFKEKIIFTGQINNVESIINIFDIGILCTNSDVHGEGISNSIMEYMALGKPVIATEGGGTNEIVIDGHTGFLIPQKSPLALANKIIELVESPERSFELGMAGKSRIAQEFSLEKMTEKYLDIYHII